MKEDMIEVTMNYKSYNITFYSKSKKDILKFIGTTIDKWEKKTVHKMTNELIWGKTKR